MVFHAFLPVVDGQTLPSAELLGALLRIGPIVVESSQLDAIIDLAESQGLTEALEVYVQTSSKSGSDDFEALLDRQAVGKVIIDGDAAEKMPAEIRARIIVKSSSPGGQDLSGFAGLITDDAAAAKASRASLAPPAPIYTSKDLVSTSALTPEEVGRRFAASLHSDRSDGLFATVVSSSSPAAPTPLGLVYSSTESVIESITSGRGVYYSRSRDAIWRKGATSGATQRVVKLAMDCDADALLVRVEQAGEGFCHERTTSCFAQRDITSANNLRGIAALERTLVSRRANAPEGSYTARLFSDAALLRQKIAEEADELIDAQDSDVEHVASEMADLIYFAMVRCVRAGVSWADVERNLDAKAEKGKRGIRRQGDAKPQYVAKDEQKQQQATAIPTQQLQEGSTQDMPVPKAFPAEETKDQKKNGDDSIRMRTSDLAQTSADARAELLRRPVMDASAMIERVRPIVAEVRDGGDAALRSLTAKFDKAQLESNVLLPPYANDAVRNLPKDVTAAIDQAYANIREFHQAQAEKEPMVVETMPGVVCTRFARPIDRVGVYVPGGTAVLPSTALMLGVPAQVAGCHTIVMATPPRPDGSVSPEVLYVADLVGASVVLKAGGAQAVAAMAYGTAECPKVDKIFGPGNQWVTAAKMLVQNDTRALVGIDMPAGPSEVMVISDSTGDPAFVASDLLSQAEHGVDSQVVLVAIDLSDERLEEIEVEVDRQAHALPRVDIIRQAIKKSLIVKVPNLEEAMKFSNEYAPEHLILHLADSPGAVKMVNNAGSVFVGAFSPESCGDYASGTNHTLPTYGYARQFSGVNTLSFQKHITSQELTREGLAKLGPIVVTLAEREGLEAHANAVRVRLSAMRKSS